MNILDLYRPYHIPNCLGIICGNIKCTNEGRINGYCHSHTDQDSYSRPTCIAINTKGVRCSLRRSKSNYCNLHCGSEHYSYGVHDSAGQLIVTGGDVRRTSSGFHKLKCSEEEIRIVDCWIIATKKYDKFGFFTSLHDAEVNAEHFENNSNSRCIIKWADAYKKQELLTEDMSPLKIKDLINLINEFSGVNHVLIVYGEDREMWAYDEKSIWHKFTSMSCIHDIEIGKIYSLKTLITQS